MNLNAYANGLTQTVNPNSPLLIRASVGQGMDAARHPIPLYDSPCAFTGMIMGNVLTVSGLTTGKVVVGQTISGVGVLPRTRTLKQLTDTTWQVSVPQTVGPVAMTAELRVVGQVQPVESWKDIQQLDALNIQGTRYKIYLYGRVEAIVRPSGQGGDLIIDATGKVYLVAMVFEYWAAIGTAEWCSVAATLQNGE